MSEQYNEVFGGQGSGGSGGGALIWNPQAQIGQYGYQVVEAGKKSGTGQYIIALSPTLYTIDQVNANTANSHIAFIDDGVTGWVITSTSANQDKYTNPTSVADEAELNATFTPYEDYLEKYCFVLSTQTYWTVKNNGVEFVWYNTGQSMIDSYSKIEADALLNLKKDKIIPLTNAGTFGSASKTIRQQVNAQGDITSILEQNIQIPSTQVTDFTEATQDAIGNALLDTNTIDLTYNDATNQISADVKNLSLDNSKIATNANIETSKIKQSIVSPYNDAIINNDSQEIINNKAQGQINHLADLLNTRPIGSSNGNIYYLTNQPSEVANYELISFSPDPSPLDIESVTINSTTTKGNRLIHSYISSYDIGGSVISGGIWGFNFYGYVSHLNSSSFEIDVYKRTGTVETLLFSCESTDLLQTSQVSPELNIANVETTQLDFACNSTDKIVIKVYAKTDRSQDTTITLLHSGTEYASHIHTPIQLTHNQLPEIQGGDATGKYHLTSNEYNKVYNLTTLGSDLVVITDINNDIKTSSITVDELNALDNIEGNIQSSLNSKEVLSNKVSAFSLTPNDTNYPTEKLVKDNLDTKVDKVVGKQLSTEDFTTAEKTKLAGIATGAEVNVQANLSQTDNLQDDYVIGKSTANIADSTDKRYITDAQQTVLVNTSGINTGDETTLSIQTKRPLKTIKNQSLEGSGNIDVTKSDVGLGDVDNTSDADKPISTAQQTALNAKEDVANKGVANGYASLDGAAKVPASQLPSYVDDVVEYANFSSFPATGVTGTIYVALDTNLTYRWSGSAYVKLNDVDLTDYFNKTVDTLDDVNAGITNKHFTATLETKLNGIEDFAQVNIQSDFAATSGDAFILNKSTQYISDSFDKRYVTESEKTLLSNTSGINTGDETTSTIQTKRPLKTIKGQSLEGSGNIDLTKADVGLSNVDNTSDADKPVSTATTNALKANSAVFVNSLIGSDNNNGLSLVTPFETVGKGLTEVTNSGNVIILGSDAQTINYTFASSQTSIKVSISDAFKISGTLNLVNGNNSIEFFNGKTNATINDDSAGTFYSNNVNLGGATLNFSRSGYKVIRGSTSTPTAINLTGSGGTLIIENVSGGVIPINIGTGWTVYIVNSLLAIGTNNGIVVDRSTTLTSVVTNQTTLNAITATTNNSLDGLHLINFANPNITGLTGLKQGDIIYKVGQFHFLSYTFESAPDVVSKALSATTREVYYKNTDKWDSIESKLTKSSNLSDITNQQTALNNLTNVSSATNEEVLTKDTATGNAIFKAIPSLQALLPTGSIVMSIATSLTGALKFDGVSAYSKTIYANLYALISAAVGSAFDVDANNFYLPDPSGRVLGVAGGGRTLFSFIGSDTHTLSISEIPSHKHDLTMIYHALTGDGFNNGRLQLTDRTSSTQLNPSEITMSNTGGGQAHNIVQKTAYIAQNLFIYY